MGIKEKSQVKKSYGIKETYVSPLTKCLIACQDSFRKYYTGLDIVDQLNNIWILLTSLTSDLQEQFNEDIDKITQLLFVTPSKATGFDSVMRSEHALQILVNTGAEHRLYARQLWAHITLALDKKGWLDKSMRDIPRNF